MSGSGRKKDPIWIYYKELPVVPGKKGTRAECKACKKELQGLVARLTNHHDKCPGKQINSGEEDEDDLEIVEDEGSSGSSTVAVRNQDGKIKKSTTENVMNKFLIKTSKEEKEKLDLQCARFICASDSSFLTANHKEFVKYTNMLRPGYNPPDRKEIAGRLLDTLYDEEIKKCSKDLEFQTVCLSSDGWSNITNDPIICNTITKNDGSVILIETLDTSGMSHSSDNLLNSIRNTIEITEKKYKCKIKSFVTDSAANMKKMREDLAEISQIICYGCSAHSLNLLAQDFGKLNNNGVVREHVIQVLKYFKSHHLPKAWYEEAGGKAIILPIDVRWNSTCNAISCYIDNWSIFVKVCEEHRTDSMIDKDIAAKVCNVLNYI